ncbi:MAG: Type 1 glutamine amidotransferase-like domain-containing protein [Candidatus Pacearchaeota archaeon]
MELILSGGGKGEQIKEINSLFFKSVGNGRIIFIPHSREKEEFQSSLNWMIENLFSPFNHSNFEMWTTLNDKSIKDLNNVRGIVIGGGNTFRLLKELKDSNFIEILRKFIKEGKVVYGISAGAIILTKSIITARPLDKNKFKLVDLEGMNLLNERGVFCHYEEKYDKEILKIIEETDMEIIGLPEGTGIYLKNSSNKIIGINSAYFFSKSGNKKELKIGKIYKYFF